MKKMIKVITAATAMMMLTGCGNKKSPENINLEKQKDEQLVFEESYIDSKFNYAEGGKFALSVISGIGNIAAGIAFDCPTSIVSGAFSIVTAINDQFNGSSGPTIADVMNKLSEMDKKLDEINDKLDQNHAQLLSETVRTQAKVDQVLLEEQEQALESFNNFYVVPLENYTRDFSDHLEQSYKSYVSKEEVAEIYLSKDEKDQWTLVDVIDEGKADQTKFTLTISDFTNSKTFLENHYNVITKGFTDCFNKDLDKAIEGVTLPSDLNKKDYRDFIGANIVERFTQKYYQENHQKALDFRNMAINYSKQITGKSATKSVLERYVNRMEYMYNFAGEMKAPVTGILANLAHNLDVYVALAAQACLYAEVSQEEIRTEYIAARELIKSYNDGIKKYDDRYSFITHTTLNSDMYRAYYKTSYKDCGNYPTFKAEFECEKVTYNGYIDYKEDDINSHYFVESTDQLRIATRMELMKEIGIVKSETYYDYLVSTKVVSEVANNTYNRLIETNWISKDALRFLTEVQTRDMSDKDKTFEMECTAAGNPNGYYFNVGWKGNFRAIHSSDCWHGKITETTYIDGITGTIQEDKRVAAYATYSESHWYWNEDEYWSFADNPVGNYFFILEHVA